MGQGQLTDDELVRLVFDELMTVPAFRAQAVDAKARGVDLLEKVREGLLETEEILNGVAKQYFAKHPEFREAPYAIFLVYRAETRDHEVRVQVGNAAITAMRRQAAMQLMSGKVGLEIVDAKR